MRTKNYLTIVLGFAALVGLLLAGSLVSPAATDGNDLLVVGTPVGPVTKSVGNTTAWLPTAESAQARRAKGKVHLVKITPNTHHPERAPKVVPDEVRIHRNEAVEWVCTTGCDFLVVFTEPGRKPFKQRAFSKGKNKSGKFNGPKGRYKYSVIVGEGSADPSMVGLD